eukprot:gb/GFBE01006499.1/.p1 GENE.gb/GFBE01006499.1/~~gb/GFBE01006499.1/.p1  ORF type:complete len:201 (+),score=57.27 gb/GFBE01006499.1/:1-603(+)
MTLTRRNGVVAVLLLMVASLQQGTAEDAFDAAPAMQQKQVSFLAGVPKRRAVSKRESKKHAAFQRSLTARSAEEAEEIHASEQRVFEQGRNMRARKTLYEKKVAACKGNHLCEKNLAERQRQIENLVASGKAPKSVVEGREDSERKVVTDGLGNELPVLFPDQGASDTKEQDSMFAWMGKKLHSAFGSFSSKSELVAYEH